MSEELKPCPFCGTLTAEQVMAIAGKHQTDYCSDTHVCFDWQAIADELNAWYVNSEPIVWCRDCRFSLAHGNGCGRNQDIYDAEPNGFCAWAERRDA